MKYLIIPLMELLLCITGFCQDFGEKYIDNPSAALSDARKSFSAGDYERTVKLYKIYQSLSGNNEDSDILIKAQKCNASIESANQYEGQGDIIEAINCYKDVLVINPNDPKVSKSIKTLASKKGYIDITRISFANTDGNGKILTNYDGTLYSEDVRYVSPLIYYNGLFSEDISINLYFKIIRPNGDICTGKSSPSGYTMSSTYTVYPGESNTMKISGWGNSNGGTYSAGTYKFEIWYNECKLFTTSFEIKSKPQVSSSQASRTYPSYTSHSRSSSSKEPFFLFRKPDKNYPDLGFLFGMGKLSTIGLEFNGNIKSFFFGIDAAVNTGKYNSDAFGNTIMGGGLITGSLGYRTQYWGAAFCGGNQWVSSMVNGKEIVQSVGFVYGPKLAIYPSPRRSHIGISIYVSYLLVPNLSELNGFKFGVGIRM